MSDDWIPNWAGNRPKPDRCDECGDDIKNDPNRYTRANSDLCKTCYFAEHSLTINVPRHQWDRKCLDSSAWKIMYSWFNDDDCKIDCHEAYEMACAAAKVDPNPTINKVKP